MLRRIGEGYLALPENKITPPAGLVVIGASLGGLYALRTILGGLPETFSWPVAIVQHRGKDSGDGLRSLLQESCRLKVEEVKDKVPLAEGQVFLAPAGYHLLLEPDYFALSTDPPVNYSRPSIDVLFESAARAYNERVIGIVLTGANQDGARGVAEIKKRKGRVIVQDPSTAENPKMPAAAINAAPVDWVLTLEEIPPCLVNLIGH